MEDRLKDSFENTVGERMGFMMDWRIRIRRGWKTAKITG